MRSDASITRPTTGHRRGRESIPGIPVEPLGLLLAIGVAAALTLRPWEEPEPSPSLPPAVSEIGPTVGPLDAETLRPPEPELKPDPEPEPKPPEPPTPDPAVIAEAEARLQSAREELERVEAEIDAVADAIEQAEAETAVAHLEARDAAEQARTKARRLHEAKARLAALKSDRDRLARAIRELETAPPPREALNRDQSPVARSVTGEEYHFEVRGNRVAFIDLERLLDMAEADARIRIRMMEPTGTVDGTVGPVGSFQLKYEVGSSSLSVVSSMVDPRLAGLGASYTLLGFEVVPTNRLRGVTIDQAFLPVSEFGRVINRLNPRQTSITLWIYPDGFAMYRLLSDALHDRGFSVAARPLPAGMPIRGSPSGSRSAAQ